MRYIDADKLILHLNDYKLQVSPSWKDEWERMVSCLVIDTCMDAVKEQPTADVRENVRGKWIKLDMHAGIADHKCSACGQECYVPTCMGDPMYIFCPYCGADMRSEL